MEAVIDGLRYKVSTATLLASDEYWDGHNFERNGRNNFLYMTPKGRYFVARLSQYQGEFNYIEALTEEEAKALYEELSEKEVDWDEAFPDSPAEDA